MAFPRYPVALDTNLLLLWLVGRTDPSLIRQHKRVGQFQPRDILRLNDMTERCAGFVTTPHVLSETSNFLDHGAKHRHGDLVSALRGYIGLAEEVSESARSLSLHASFAEFGLADTGLLTLSARCIVLTTDLRLANFILKMGGKAQPFFSASH